jgi:hypothetical protein
LGKNKQTGGGQRLLPILWLTHALKSASEANDDRLPAAEQNTETFPFHRCVEAADYATALIPPARGLMYWADGIGVAEVYRQIQAWHQQYGADHDRWSAASPSKRLARYTLGMARPLGLMRS